MLDFVVDHPARVRPAGEFEWTDEAVERLKELHKKGLTGGQIAAELGCPSRNAVCGKIDRLRRGNFAADFAVRGRAAAHAPRKRANAPAKRRTETRVTGHGSHLRVTEVQVKDLPPAATSSLPFRRVALADLDMARDCRWIVNDDTKRAEYCGLEREFVADDSRGVYCRHHATLGINLDSRRGLTRAK